MPEKKEDPKPKRGRGRPRKEVKKEEPKPKAEPEQKRGRGRPRIDIDIKEFEKLCSLQCTANEISYAFNCSVDTLERWCERTYNMKFEEVFEIKRQGGFISLRRMSWQSAMEGNVQMLIHLRKHLLGEHEKQQVENKVSVEKNEFGDLTSDELRKLAYSKSEKSEK